ncbi:MAG: hypothetical protein M5U13_04585 [Thermoanaerobaculia bacterium]|nr:hypothetical protein [Thermoanaerobaculia bacterium]
MSAAGRSFPLAVLLPAPLSSHPSDGAEGLERLDEITLTFPDPVDPAALAAALEVEIAPLPGVGSEGARRLAPGEVAVKPLPPGSAGAPAYALRLPAPVPGGHRVRLRLRLSPEAGDGALAAELAFATATPFRALAFGCRERQLPVLPAGARYPAERALACEADDPAVVVDFSALPRELGIAEARNLVRLSPPVPDLAASLSGRRLELRGAFARETAYRVRLVPAPLGDETGRPLDLAGANELVLSFPRPSPYLRLAAATGIAERRGPQMVPLAGRGEERIDLRIHRIDPLDRAFWPFPAAPVAVDEGRRPRAPASAPPPGVAPRAAPRPTRSRRGSRPSARLRSRRSSTCRSGATAARPASGSISSRTSRASPARAPPAPTSSACAASTAAPSGAGSGSRSRTSRSPRSRSRGGPSSSSPRSPAPSRSRGPRCGSKACAGRAAARAGSSSSAAAPTPRAARRGAPPARREWPTSRWRGSRSRPATTSSCSTRSARPRPSTTDAGAPTAAPGCSGPRRRSNGGAASPSGSPTSSPSGRSTAPRSRCT